MLCLWKKSVFFLYLSDHLMHMYRCTDPQFVFGLLLHLTKYHDLGI